MILLLCGFEVVVLPPGFLLNKERTTQMAWFSLPRFDSVLVKVHSRFELRLPTKKSFRSCVDALDSDSTRSYLVYFKRLACLLLM